MDAKELETMVLDILDAQVESLAAGFDEHPNIAMRASEVADTLRAVKPMPRAALEKHIEENA